MMIWIIHTVSLAAALTHI